MPSARKPEITSGQSLDVQPGISNIGENQATLEALRNANIDGQDVYPQSVSTKRFAADDGNFSGMIKSGTMLVGSGGVTVTSDADGGTPATGLHIGTGTLQLIKSGVPQVTLNGSTGNATFVGSVTATSGTFTGTVNATAGYFVGSITIGSDQTVGGAATGVWLTNTQLLMKYAGATKVDFDTSANTYYVKGELFADKITITSNAANTVDFGSNVTISGNLIMQYNSTANRFIYFVGAATGYDYIGYNYTTAQITLQSQYQLYLQAYAPTAYAASILLDANSGNITITPQNNLIINGTVQSTAFTSTTNLTHTIPNSASYYFYVKNASGTTHLSIKGSTGAASFGGFVTVAGLSSSASIYGAHKSTAGAARADGSLTFYAAASGGGSINRKVDITFADGLITVMTVTAI